MKKEKTKNCFFEKKGLNLFMNLLMVEMLRLKIGISFAPLCRVNGFFNSLIYRELGDMSNKYRHAVL